MRSKVIDHRIQTKLAVKEVATTFRDGLQARPKGVVGFVASKALEWDFFNPDDETDPFAQFDDDKPDFSVGATYGLRHANGPRMTEFRVYIEATTGGAVLLSIWDRSPTQQLEVSDQSSGVGPEGQRC